MTDPELTEDVPGRIHRSLYGKSDAPEHADNRDSREFLDGYAEGLVHESESGLDAITDEWITRGSPETLPAGFREWKRGFNAGSFRRIWSGSSRAVGVDLERSDSEAAAAGGQGGVRRHVEWAARVNEKLSDSGGLGGAIHGGSPL